MAISGDAQAIHLAWPTASDDQAHIHYLQLNERAETVVDVNLELPAGRVRSPRLLTAGDDNLHLLWAIRPAGSSHWELWYTLLDYSGDSIGTAEQISAPDSRVSSYVVGQSPGEQGYIVWEDDATGGLVGASVSDQGVGEPVTLAESGTKPGVAVDEKNTLHLAWLDQSDLKYANFPAAELNTVEGTVVASLDEVTGNTLDGPAINLAAGQVYIAWSIFANVGLESGSGWTEYISFPADSPERSPSTRIWILPDEDQPYDPYDGNYPLTVLADPVTSPMLTTNIILEPNAAGPQGDELAMVVSANQNQRLDEFVQMILVLFEDGQFKGYQLAGKTESLSREGYLQLDRGGNLHLAWREGTGNKLYYASTAPEIRAGLDRLGREDLAAVILGGGMDALTGALFFPLSFIWFLPGIVILGIRKLRRDDETINSRISQFLVVFSIVTYQLMKVLFMPTISTYVPFSAWIDVPEGMKTSLQIIVPALILLFGVIVAEIVRRRRPSTSSLIYFLIITGVDAIFTLGVYGVGYLGYI